MVRKLRMEWECGVTTKHVVAEICMCAHTFIHDSTHALYMKLWCIFDSNCFAAIRARSMNETWSRREREKRGVIHIVSEVLCYAGSAHIFIGITSSCHTWRAISGDSDSAVCLILCFYMQSVIQGNAPLDLHEQPLQWEVLLCSDSFIVLNFW
jgi:hypothetical protein